MTKTRFSRAPRSGFRPSIDGLESRLLMATDLIATSATATSASVVVVNYQIAGDPAPNATLSIYRSTDATFSPSDVALSQLILTGSLASVGAHTVEFTLADPLDINPSAPYVLAVLDPAGSIAETSEANNVASFRKWSIAAVTHGVTYDGQFPAWVTQTAAALDDAGFDAAIPFNWTAASNTAAPIPGSVVTSLVDSIALTAQGLPRAPQDVVDVQLIGFSRGGGLMSQAAARLPGNAAYLQGGYLKLTLLDPHPTYNAAVPYFSSSGGPIGNLSQQLFVAFQAGANDPPLAIPASVDGAEVFFQHTPVVQAATGDERIINSWGTVPAASSAGATTYYDVTDVTRSHDGVPLWYLQAVVPGLATDQGPPVPIVPTPAVPTGGGPYFATQNQGAQYELQLLTGAGGQRVVSTSAVHGFARLNRSIALGRPNAAIGQINSLERMISRQSGRGLPAPLATSLLGLLERARASIGGIAQPLAASARRLSPRG